MPGGSLPLVLTLAFVLAVYSVYAIYSRHVLSKKRLPDIRPIPGPKGLPWLGPVNQLPRLGTFLKFAQWGKQYGPFYQVELLGRKHIFVCDEKIANDLFSKRSEVYSGRPPIATLNDSQSKRVAEYLPLMSKNANHTRHKKWNHIVLTTALRHDFYNYPSIEAKRLVWNMMHDSTNWLRQLEDFTSRISCRLTWGTPDYAQELHHDSWTMLIHISPSGFLTNLVNPLMQIPKWMAPFPWRRLEEARYERQRQWFLRNMENVRRKLDQRTAGPSFMRTYLQMQGPTKDVLTSDLDAAFAVGMLAVTAVFTSSSPMITCIRALMMYPEWLRKVQEELDRVVGSSRMPELADSPELPILRACIREAMRWRPPIPGGRHHYSTIILSCFQPDMTYTVAGIPHETERDDFYNGYFIPKGTSVHPLEFAFSRDPTTYPNPHAFMPERWLSSKYPTYREPLTQYPTTVGSTGFGWGRRYCQGQDLTQQECFLACASMFWAFQLRLKDSEQLPLPKEDECEFRAPMEWEQSLIIVRPEQFDVEFTVRSEVHKATMRTYYELSKMSDVDILRGFEGSITVQ